MKNNKPLQWKVEEREINEIFENPKNPRTMSKKSAALLENSIERFGICEPIVLNSENLIIGGHQRKRILEKLGFSRVLVMVPSRNINEEDAEDLALLLNKASGTWDFDMLANCWDIEKLLANGFSNSELDLERNPEQRAKPRAFKLTVKCENEDQLNLVEETIAPLLEEHGATYKVKIS